MNRFRRATRSFEESQWLAVRRAALFAEAEIKKGLRSSAPGGQRFKPLSDITRILRRGTKPLLDTGSLLGSIKTTLDRRSRAAFVGVHRTARNPEGVDVVNIAVVHEFGTSPFVIEVTEGVRRFFWALHFKSGGKIKPLSPNKRTILHPGVPARPFIRPVIDKIAPEIQKMIRSAIIKNGGPI